MRYYNDSAVCDCFKTPFPVDCAIQALNLPDKKIVELTTPKKETATPLIC